MTSRSLAGFVGVVAILVFLGAAPNKDKAKSARSQRKGNNAAAAPAAPAGDKEDATKDEGEKAAANGDGASGKSGAAKSESDSKSGPVKGKIEKATFGGGCFWSIEAIFERIPGVKSAVSGFAGGAVPNPSYDMVCTGQTGHAEVVQVEYDTSVITYDQLLKVFWKAHNPTTLNYQGEDFGPQYRSIIFYHTEEQRAAALKSYRALTAAKAFPHPIVTDLQPLTAFYPAEAYHQDYYRWHRDEDYCQMVIAPKLRKLKLRTR